MKQSTVHTVVQAAALVGLAVSSFLFIQYELPPGLGGCPVGGACHQVRACWIGGLGSSVWPLLGVVGFLTVLTLSLSSRSWARKLLVGVGLLGGALGVGLLVAQPLVCGAFCPYCLVTDSAAIAVAAGAWMGRKEPAVIARGRRWGFALLAVVVLIGPYVWGVRRAREVPTPVALAELPGPIAREQRANTVTLVEFMDTTCPACQRQHPELAQALAGYGAKVQLIRKLRSGTQEAEVGARAVVCAEAAGKGEAMVEALVHAQAPDRERSASIAGGMGLDAAAFRACLDAPATTARIEADRQAANEAQIVLLPTLFVGHERIDGNIPTAAIKASIDRQMR